VYPRLVTHSIKAGIFSAESVRVYPIRVCAKPENYWTEIRVTQQEYVPR